MWQSLNGNIYTAENPYDLATKIMVNWQLVKKFLYDIFDVHENKEEC